MNKVQRERLEKLADNLDQLPSELFNLKALTIGCLLLTAQGTKKRMKKVLKDGHNCGTTGCAIGYCPIWFPRLFKYRISGGVEGVRTVKSEFSDTIFNVEWDDEARRVFGITDQEVDYLFIDDTYPMEDHRNPKAVVTRIRKFLKERLED